MLAIPLPWLWWKCATADPVMYETSMRALEVLKRRLDGDDHLVARIEHLIAASGQRPPTLAQLAKRVHMSTRTVIRHLRRAGTTYQQLVDAHRREQALTLLRTRDIDIAEVGYHLGYQDPANFGRACRRWFGMAPSRCRVQLLDT
jgi:AraC-like DNA-binding protein